MSHTYPKRNPFPYQGTESLDGTWPESELEDLDGSSPTLMLDPVAQTLDLAKEYFGRFHPSMSHKGQVGVIHGEHGSGKTHAIRYVINWLIDRCVSENFLQCIQMYAKAGGPDFMVTYRQLVGRISYEELNDLSLRFFGVVAREQIRRELGSAEADTAIAEILKADPRQVYNLYSKYVVDAGDAQDIQAKEVERVAGSADDFRRALSHLASQERDLAKKSYNWLTGKPVVERDLRMLGISRELSSDEDCELALEVLAALFNRVGQPFIIYIDQIENLIDKKHDKLGSQNVGLLRSLVEVIPRENGMLLLAGNEDSWNSLPPDLISRLAGNDITFRVLKLKEAIDLIRLYLTASENNFVADGSEEDLFPFTPDAVREIVKYSAGNIRKLLQICSAAFDLAFEERTVIGSDVIKTVLKNSKNPYFSHRDVLSEIHQIVIENGLRVEIDFRIQNVAIDVAVVDITGRPILLVEISSAVFHDNEAKRALGKLKKIQRIRQGHVAIPIVLVVIGYISPDVINVLNKAAEKIIVYRPETFRETFTGLMVEFANVDKTRATSATEFQRLETRLAELQAELLQTLSVRESEVKVLERRLSAFFEQQNADRQKERKDAARLAWLDERRRLEERIQGARDDRKAGDLQQLEQLRKREYERRDRRASLLNSVMTASILMTIVISALTIAVRILNTYQRRLGPAMSLDEIISMTIRNPVSLMLMLGILGLFLIRQKDFLAPFVRKTLSSPVTSVEELEYMAREYMAEASRTSSRVEYLLRNPDPYKRYFGACIAEPTRDHAALLRAVQFEGARIVKRAIGKRIGEIGDAEGIKVDALIEQPEVLAYVVEGVAKRDKLPKSWTRQLPRKLHILALIYGMNSEEVNSGSLLERFLAEIHAPKGEQGISVLIEAFRQPNDSSLSSAISKYSMPDFREAVRILSPFDESGLGTYDELRSIEEIDHYFLFFSELLFLAEHNFVSVST